MDGYEIEQIRSGHENLSYRNQNNVAFAHPAHLSTTLFLLICNEKKSLIYYLLIY